MKKQLSKGKVRKDIEGDISFESPKLTHEQRLKSLEVFKEYRRRKESGRTEEDRMKSRLLQLKFIMEDYLDDDGYDRTRSFAFFLREYVDRLHKKSNVFAREIGIKPTVVSQLINSHRDPNTEIMLRLEAHSNNIFPAIIWYRIANKDREFLFLKDDAQKKAEQRHVKKRLEFTL